MKRLLAFLHTPDVADTADLGANWASTEPWIRMGRRTILLLVACVLVGALMPISGAVVTTGMVNVETSYKTVQHLDGGIVSKILVKNGDKVGEGDVLVELDDTTVKANLAVTEGHVNDFLIQQARLEAERDKKKSFDIPAGIDVKDPAIAKIIAGQRSLFDARRTSHQGEVAVLTQRVGQLTSEIKGLEAQLASNQKQYDLTAKELATIQPLYDKGYANAQRLSPLQHEVARLEGEIGRVRSDITKSQGALAEAELRLAQSDKEFLSQVVDELRKVQASLAEQQENRKSLADKVARAIIRSPRTGRVHALAVHTEGGVITPASTILQIIPDGDKMVVAGQLQPKDIDRVHIGQTAYVRFTAFSSRSTPRLDGRVTKVSPAEITDQQGKTYFTAEVEVPADEIARLGSGHELKPGMPADMFLETKSHSILFYFLKPLIDALSHTFRES
jgi:HlyD family secretion protein